MPYFLAEQGFDVWIGTSRGTSIPEYSDHTVFNSISDAASYWNYTIDTKSKYDFPAMVNYILENTPAKEIDYIGHNVGASSALIAMAYEPWLDKINTVTVL